MKTKIYVCLFSFLTLLINCKKEEEDNTQSNQSTTTTTTTSANTNKVIFYVDSVEKISNYSSLITITPNTGSNGYHINILGINGDADNSESIVVFIPFVFEHSPKI